MIEILSVSSESEMGALLGDQECESPPLNHLTDKCMAIYALEISFGKEKGDRRVLVILRLLGAYRLDRLHQEQPQMFLQFLPCPSRLLKSCRD